MIRRHSPHLHILTNTNKNATHSFHSQNRRLSERLGLIQIPHFTDEGRISLPRWHVVSLPGKAANEQEGGANPQIALPLASCLLVFNPWNQNSCPLSAFLNSTPIFSYLLNPQIQSLMMHCVWGHFEGRTGPNGFRWLIFHEILAYWFYPQSMLLDTKFYVLQDHCYLTSSTGSRWG